MILSDWVMKWGMKTSIDKCKVMHLEKKQPNYVYTVIASKLAVTTQRRNFTVIMDNSMKTSHNNTVFCTRQICKFRIINKQNRKCYYVVYIYGASKPRILCVCRPGSSQLYLFKKGSEKGQSHIQNYCMD